MKVLSKREYNEMNITGKGIANHICWLQSHPRRVVASSPI
jgi:hypothetical protein